MTDVGHICALLALCIAFAGIPVVVAVLHARYRRRVECLHQRLGRMGEPTAVTEYTDLPVWQGPEWDAIREYRDDVRRHRVALWEDARDRDLRLSLADLSKAREEESIARNAETQRILEERERDRIPL